MNDENTNAATSMTQVQSMLLLDYVQHKPNCAYEERECSQLGCGETHVTPCNCGLEKAIAASSYMQAAELQAKALRDAADALEKEVCERVS